MLPVHFSDEDSEICRELRRAVTDTSSGQYAFVQNLKSGTAVPLLVGEKVVGTLSAVSSSPARQLITEEDGRWTGQVMGVHQHHEHFLQSCAEWLGPALVPIQQLVRRSRQLSMLSTAI